MLESDPLLTGQQLHNLLQVDRITIYRLYRLKRVIGLVRSAQNHGVPLVPRGKSLSGCGGVLPVQGGLVVDFAWMNEVLAIDAEAMTATVQPGVVCDKLEHRLNKKGLAVRTYPSGAPSSMVGGWLAQVGVGFGAFLENGLAFWAVLPDGQVREFSGTDLELVSDAEGTTDLVMKVMIRVCKHEPQALWGRASIVPLTQARDGH